MNIFRRWGVVCWWVCHRDFVSDGLWKGWDNCAPREEKQSGYYTCAVINFRVDQKKTEWKSETVKKKKTRREPWPKTGPLKVHQDLSWHVWIINFEIFLQNATSEIRIKIGSGDRGLWNVRIKISTQSWNRTIAHHTTIEPVVSLTIIINERNRHQVSSDDEGRDCHWQCEV